MAKYLSDVFISSVPPSPEDVIVPRIAPADVLPLVCEKSELLVRTSQVFDTLVLPLVSVVLMVIETRSPGRAVLLNKK